MYYSTQVKFLSIHTVKFLEGVNFMSWANSDGGGGGLSKKSRYSFMEMFLASRERFYAQPGSGTPSADIHNAKQHLRPRDPEKSFEKFISDPITFISLGQLCVAKVSERFIAFCFALPPHSSNSNPF